MSLLFFIQVIHFPAFEKNLKNTKAFQMRITKFLQRDFWAD